MQAIQDRPALTIIVPKEAGLKPYRLHARFSIKSYPPPAALDEAVKTCAEKFIEDMAKQGWEYLDQHGVFLDPEPKPHFDIYDAPKRSQQEEWHVNARQVQDPRSVQRLKTVGTPGVLSLPSVAHSDVWDFDISAVFLHKALITEYD